LIPLEELLAIAIGAASVTTERAQQLLETLRVRGRLGEDEGKQLVEELLETAKKRRAELEQLAKELVREQLAKAGVCTKGELESVRGELDALRRQLVELEQRFTSQA
jgi:polyhydroxyalkanoate synthesis regulator phasin